MIEITFILALTICLQAGYASWATFRTKEVFVIYWLGSLYFAGMPLLTDSVMYCLNLMDVWGSWLQGGSPHSYHLDLDTLYRASVYVLVFNTAFWLGTAIVPFFFNSISWHDYHPTKWFVPKSLLLSGLLIPWVCLFITIAIDYRGFISAMLWGNGIPELAHHLGLSLWISGAFAYLALWSGRFRVWLLIIIPILAQSYLISSRANAFPAIAASFLALLHRSERISRRHLYFGAVMLPVALIITNLLLLGRDSSVLTIGDSLRIFTNLLRDESTREFYYCLSSDLSFSTSGGATAFLFTTGIPDFLLGFRRDFEAVDVTGILAAVRTNQPYWTSFHPTIYGWSFVDLGWLGPLLGFILGALIHSILRITRRSVIQNSLAVCLLSGFIFISLRGSVQYAYSHAIYGFLVGVPILLIASKFFPIVRVLPPGELNIEGMKGVSTVEM